MHDRLKELRKSAHLSQKSLGNLIGISQQVVSRIERDSSTMTREHLELYADFFNVTTDYILGRSKAKRNLEEQRVLLDKLQEKYNLVQIFDILKEDYQEIVWDLMDVMAAKMEKSDEKARSFHRCFKHIWNLNYEFFKLQGRSCYSE